jgi:cytochrome c-type biogenesis protein
MFGFGVSYAVASLTCTVAPFLAVVVSAFRADSWFAGSALFLLYAAGMCLVVGTAALGVALTQQSLVRGARRLGRLVPTVGGVSSCSSVSTSPTTGGGRSVSSGAQRARTR